jgi:mycothiol system anti-sigma-R factor
MDRLSCLEVFERLEDYLDRELNDAEMEKVRSHLADCSICASEYAFEGSLLTELREKLSRLTTPADLIARVSRAIAEARGGRETS